MASFTSEGDTLELFVPNRGEVIDIDISGTYNMQIDLERETGSRNSDAWETIRTVTTTANSTIAEQYTTREWDENIRLRVIVDTSGTATATLTDNDDRTILAFKDDVGNTKATYAQSGVTFPDDVTITGDLTVTGEVTLNGGLVGPDPVPLTGNTTLTQAAHAGRTIVFNDADGATLTLPAATGTGDIYRFVVGVTVTSNSDIIQVANATDEFVGNVLQVDTDTSDTLAAYPALDGDGFDTVTLNGTTTGGIQGDYIEIQDIATGKFSIRGTVLSNGTVATPLSAAVS